MRLILAGALLASLAGGLLIWRPWSAPPRRQAPPVPVSPERLRAQSAEARARAGRLIAERGVRPENLDEAVRILEACRESLKPQARREPGPYVAVSEALSEARDLRDRVVKDLWVDYHRQVHLGDAAGAQATLRLILRTSPDRRSPDNARARAALSRYLASE